MINEYIAIGWRLVPIAPYSKGPTHYTWNQETSCIGPGCSIVPGMGVGLAHAYSGTMALDVDDWALTYDILLKEGINLRALMDAPDAVQIVSGREGHAKLLYRILPWMKMPSKQIKYTRPGERKSTLAMELRCMTQDGLTVQDVLPPTIHPETKKPYQWGGRGHYANLPLIPSTLYEFWRKSLLPTMKVVAPEREIPPSVQQEGPSTPMSRVHGALYAIDPNLGRDDWITVGMALHHHGTEMGNLPLMFDLWDTWSQGSVEKYKGRKDLVTCWRSFKAQDGITTGSLFLLALQHGWVRPVEDLSGRFLSIKTLTPERLLESWQITAPNIDPSMFPPILARRAGEVATSVGCNPVIPLFAGLAAICAAVDARTRLIVHHDPKATYKVPPILWLMVIGAPGDKKSWGSRPMLECLRYIEEEDQPRYQADMLKWSAKQACHASQHKAYLEAAKDPTSMIDGNGTCNFEILPIVTPLEPPPVPVRLSVVDVTSQKLVRMIADRPRGMLAYLDEMHGFLRKLSSPHSGEDPGTWLKAYDGGYHQMDRVGDGKDHGSTLCTNLAISMYTNVQPHILVQHAQYIIDNGFLPRFIPGTCIAGSRLSHPIHADETNVEEWENLIRVIYTLPTNEYKLSFNAWRLFRDFQVWFSQTQNDLRVVKRTVHFQSAIGKVEGMLARLALVFHLLITPYNPEVQRETMERAITLVKRYIMPSIKHLYYEIITETGKGKDFALWLMGYIVEHSETQSTITLGEIKTRGRVHIANVPQNQVDQYVIGVMGEMEQAGWVRLREKNNRVTLWEIDAHLTKTHHDYRRMIRDAKARLKDQSL